MTDQNYLKHCLKEVEKKLNWQQSKFWKESDYIKLSKHISTDSNISISPHTLKRLFGKLKYNQHYNPQHATKDALSKFLGYVDWDDFVLRNKTEVEAITESSVEVKSKKGFSNKNIILGGLLLILISSILLLISNLNSKEGINDFQFSLKDVIGEVPFTVSANYNISNINSDSVFIDFDFVHPIHGAQLIKQQKTDSILNFTYQIPGYYEVELKQKNKTLSTQHVLALSKGWNSYINYESKLNKFWLDNEISTLTNFGDSLYYSSNTLAKNGFDVKSVFYITHRLYKLFEIDGDNFEFETKFKNSKKLGGISCYDFIIKLICENNVNYLSLMENGCSQFSGVKFGETVLRGVQKNLSSFKINLEDWNLLRVIVKQKSVQVFVNEVLIYEDTYLKSNGKIVGIENILKGAGMIDYIKIRDLKTNTAFVENFEK